MHVMDVVTEHAVHFFLLPILRISLQRSMPEFGYVQRVSPMRTVWRDARWDTLVLRGPN